MENRNAKQLAEILRNRTRKEAAAPELHALADLAETLEQLPAPQVSAEWQRNARARILRRVGVSSGGFSPRRLWTMRLSSAFATTALIVAFLFTGGVFSFTAQSALPGDLLFPVKLIMEDIQLLPASDAQDAILRSQFANNRLTEIQLLIVEDRFADVEIAVSAFEDNVDEAVLSLARIALNDSTSTYPVLVRLEEDMLGYTNSLNELLAVVPSQTQPILARAIAASESLTFNTD